MVRTMQLTLISATLCFVTCFGMQDPIKQYKDQVTALTKNRLRKEISIEQYVNQMSALFEQAKMNNIEIADITDDKIIETLLNKALRDNSTQEILLLFRYIPYSVTTFANKYNLSANLSNALGTLAKERVHIQPIIEESTGLPSDTADIVSRYLFTARPRETKILKDVQQLATVGLKQLENKLAIDPDNKDYRELQQDTNQLLTLVNTAIKKDNALLTKGTENASAQEIIELATLTTQAQEQFNALIQKNNDVMQKIKRNNENLGMLPDEE